MGEEEQEGWGSNLGNYSENWHGVFCPNSYSVLFH